MTSWVFVAFVTAAIVITLLLSGFIPTWRRFRGTRLITCPENIRPAAVKVDAVRAAEWFAATGETPLRLSACSRWPEMSGCGQECLSQVEASPEGCLVHTIVANWYDGKSCHYCGHGIEQIAWHERPPAVRLPNATTTEWKDVATEDLPDAFAHGDPVCWPCHIRETFRREHRALVVERPRVEAPKPVLEPSLAVY